MERRTVSVRVGGQSYKVVSSAPDDELARLAAMVDAKLLELMPSSRATSPQAMVLVAMAFAHDLETERGRRRTLERKSRDMLRRVLVRVENALDSDEGEEARG
jgi:cell division protein ZapA